MGVGGDGGEDGGIGDEGGGWWGKMVGGEMKGWGRELLREYGRDEMLWWVRGMKEVGVKRVE